MPDTFQVVDDMRIPMRDGISLSARIWIPHTSATTPLPAILEILPYRKRDGTVPRDATTHAHFVKHDYVCLRVDLRGSGESDGLFDDEYSETELADIEDTLTWISTQKWCSGAVGMMGISWGGFNGLQTAFRQPEALKAVITSCSTVDRFADDIHYKGGCQLTNNIGWFAQASSWFSMPPDPALVGEAWRDIWLQRLQEMPFLASTWIRHSSRDAYWKHGSVAEDFSRLKTPILSIGGWHDGYRNTPLNLLEGGTTGPVKAIIGPWNHKYPNLGTPGPRFDFVDEALRWWDQWLKGKDTGVADDPAYRAYVMDAIEPARSYDTRPGHWVGLQDWPSPHVTQTVLELGDTDLGGAPMKAPRSIATDPLCGQCMGEFFPFGFLAGDLPDDQTPDDARSMCFETATLPDLITLIGAAKLSIEVASDQPFGQVAARLSDVAPDGRATLISHGFLNLEFRDGFAARVPLVPGVPVDATVTLDQMAYAIPAGHRLRLALSPSYWPFIWPSPGPTTLTIANGTLALSQLIGHDTAPVFKPAAPVSAAVTKTLRRPDHSREVTRKDGIITLTKIVDNGEAEYLDHGLRVSSRQQEHWSINEQDISIANVDIYWTRAIRRGDFDVRTTVKTSMRAENGVYTIASVLKVYEDDTFLFERAFNDVVDQRPETKRKKN